MFQSVAVINSALWVREKFIAEQIASLNINKLDLFVYTETVTIAKVRELKSLTSRKPVASAYQMHIINAENLTFEAQAALLKILEEPPAYVLIYISTPSLELLLPTTVSRLKLIYPQDKVEGVGETFEKSLKFWQVIFRLPQIQRLKFTDELAKDRIQALVWLEEQLQFFQNLLEAFPASVKAPLSLPPTDLSLSLRLLLKTKKYLAGNVSIKLALDQLFLQLPWAGT